MLDYRAASQLCATSEVQHPPITWRGLGDGDGDKHSNGLNSTTPDGYASKADQLLNWDATNHHAPPTVPVKPVNGPVQSVNHPPRRVGSLGSSLNPHVNKTRARANHRLNLEQHLTCHSPVELSQKPKLCAIAVNHWTSGVGRWIFDENSDIALE